MQTTVFCKTTAKAKQTYYVSVEGKSYLLFEQDFRKSNKEFFEKGVPVSEIGRYSNAHSASVRKTLDKLSTYLRYIEKEYDVAIFGQCKRNKNSLSKKGYSYKRQAFRWQDQAWEVA